MTEANDEGKPSTRLKGEVEEQDLAYAPPAYAAIDGAKPGRWRMLGEDAAIWTDEAEGAGVLWLGRSEEVAALRRFLSAAKSAELPAITAYELAVTKAGDLAGRELSGRLQELLDDLDDLMDDRGDEPESAEDDEDAGEDD